MKVQLVVIQGKPEGKTIPLVGPKFKIGRGEGCHLRPNSDQVSREHAEFEVGPESVTVRDLGSRNGTDVNGKPLAKDQRCTLKNGDLVKVGSLTFAVAIEGAIAAKPAGPARKSSIDDASHDDIDAWLVSDEARPTPDRPSGVYGGDTITIDSFKEMGKDKPAAKAPAAKAPAPAPAPAAKAPAPAPAPAAKPPAPVPAPPPKVPTPVLVAKAPEPEPETEPETEPEEEAAVDEVEQYTPDDDDGIEDLSKAAESGEIPEEYMDESNPFYVKKKEAAPSGPAAKDSTKNSSDAAGDILRKMMDRRKASRS